MSSYISIEHVGGPEVLNYRERPVPTPGPGEILVQQTMIGVNFIDVYHRTGLYKTELPLVPGVEAVGRVAALGGGVSGFAEGDRVAYAPMLGAYAEHRTLPAERAVKVPAALTDEVVAATFLKGLTARYLLRQTFALKAAHTVLFHAAAGGVGLLACQWAQLLGARVIGTVGSEEKAELAREHGCSEVVLYSDPNWPAKVRSLTGGVGVDVVYDSVGQATFQGSLDCLKRRGTLVLFGQSSGSVPPVDVALLMSKGSLYLTRPTLMDYVKTRAELEEAAAELFAVLDERTLAKAEVNTKQLAHPDVAQHVLGNSPTIRGVVARIGARYALKDAAVAQRALEARKTTGSIVLEVI